MRDHHGVTALDPDELALLQECFDSILKERLRSTAVAKRLTRIATALLTAYRRGITDKVELIRLADLIDAA